MAKRSIFLFGIGLTLVGFILIISYMTSIQATSGSQAFLFIVDFVIFFLGIYLTIKSLFVKAVGRKIHVNIAYPDEELKLLPEEDIIYEIF